MTTGTNRESAQIYQFPPRGRAGIGSKHDAAVPSAESLPPVLPNAIYGSSWYHDVAIQTAGSVAKR